MFGEDTVNWDGNSKQQLRESFLLSLTVEDGTHKFRKNCSHNFLSYSD
jgi:hypothetical protein